MFLRWNAIKCTCHAGRQSLSVCIQGQRLKCRFSYCARAYNMLQSPPSHCFISGVDSGQKSGMPWGHLGGRLSGLSLSTFTPSYGISTPMHVLVSIVQLSCRKARVQDPYLFFTQCRKLLLAQHHCPFRQVQPHRAAWNTKEAACRKSARHNIPRHGSK